MAQPKTQNKENGSARPIKPTKTLGDARRVVFECIDDVRQKKLPAAEMNSITTGVATAIRTYKLELEVLKMCNLKPDASFLQLIGKV